MALLSCVRDHVNADELVITADGVEGDFNRWRTEKAAGDPDQAVLLLADEILAELRAEGWPVGPGDLGENLLLAGLPGNALADYLSGLLVGHELVSGLAASRTAREAGAPLVLIGDASLCRRYAHALKTFDTAVHAQLENTAPRGLWEFARAAGLLL